MTPPPRHRLSAWILVVILAVATPAAASWHGTLTTPELQMLGESSTRGPLTVLLQEKTQAYHDPGDPAFRLQAEFLHLESDHTDLSLYTTAAAYYHDVKTSTVSHDDAVVEGTTHHDGYQFSVWPITDTPPIVHLPEKRCASISPSSEPTVNRIARIRFDYRPPNVASTFLSPVWSGCDDASATVTGDFLLRLWQWDAELTADGETRPLPSGWHSLEGAPQTVDTTPLAGQATERFLYAYNATLTIPRLTGNYAAYVEEADVVVSAFQIQEATGAVDGPRRVEMEGQEAYLQGDLTLHVRSTGEALAIILTGDLDEAHLDGVAATLTPAPLLPGGTGPVLLSLLAVATVLGLVGLAWHQAPLLAYRLNRVLGGAQGSLAPATRRERRGAGHWVLSRVGNHVGWHRRSLRHAIRAHRMFPLLPEAKLMVAVASSHLGRHETALVDFADAYTRLRSPTARAMTACAAAEASCRLGDPDLAREWLRDAARDDPAFTLGRVRLRRFDALAGSDWFPVWRRLLAQRVSGTGGA